MRMRTTAAVVLLTAGALLPIGCEDDGAENFETDNEVDGSESESEDQDGPAGTVDSREPVEGHQDGDDAPSDASTTSTAITEP